MEVIQSSIKQTQYFVFCIDSYQTNQKQYLPNVKQYAVTNNRITDMDKFNKFSLTVDQGTDT